MVWCSGYDTDESWRDHLQSRDVQFAPSGFHGRPHLLPAIDASAHAVRRLPPRQLLQLLPAHLSILRNCSSLHAGKTHTLTKTVSNTFGKQDAHLAQLIKLSRLAYRLPAAQQYACVTWIFKQGYLYKSPIWYGATRGTKQYLSDWIDLVISIQSPHPRGSIGNMGSLRGRVPTRRPFAWPPSLSCASSASADASCCSLDVCMELPSCDLMSWYRPLASRECRFLAVILSISMADSRMSSKLGPVPEYSLPWSLTLSPSDLSSELSLIYRQDTQRPCWQAFTYEHVCHLYI